MKDYYQITEKIRDLLKAEPFTNTVTLGDPDEVDLSKATVFPLGHITVNEARIETSRIIFNISVSAMDIVDFNKESTEDVFLKNDNEQDVLNTQLAVLNRLFNALKRNEHLHEMDQEMICEPFNERHENNLAGWTGTFDVAIPNEMTIC